MMLRTDFFSIRSWLFVCGGCTFRSLSFFHCCAIHQSIILRARLSFRGSSGRLFFV
ncbi:hypothetical protein DW228_11195 [Bacteroides fragilis]|uniref:Uncharacterized protein n=1 Tax=Bacteroides fragilis TaxID=817 RepID=A0A396BVP4_BACFG|nr:hypothetical protein IA74_010445 [Bacteroides fragilis]QCQ51529.1 hypothetical protein EE52_020160 [Bacteroides fragilis]QCQ54439.1 hypothetical protein EC81_011785 [Bacteroides fragilis]RGN65068.1 hypothetical protein DXB60_06970 [Bacteroides fragilis]RHH11036.1 hypothetical protein DW228_11195 [Bacteroides fragilis]